MGKRALALICALTLIAAAAPSVLAPPVYAEPSQVEPPVGEAQRQVESFYNVTLIESLSLEELGWVELRRIDRGSVRVIEGEFTAGQFEGYTRRGELIEAPLTMRAVAVVPERPRGGGIVLAVHEESNLERKWSEYGEELVELSRETGIPILMYGQERESIEPFSLDRGALTLVTFYALTFLNRGHTDVVTANFILALARTQSYAITVLQRLVESVGGRVEGVAFMAGSKEGYAQWIASTVDDRIEVSSPGGFKTENLTAAIDEGVSQWGCYNPYLERRKRGWSEMLRLKAFLAERRDVEAEISVARRIERGLAKAELYVVTGDVGAYGTHDGKHFPLGAAEAEFLESLDDVSWVYSLDTPDGGAGPSFLRKVKTLAWLLSEGNREEVLGYRPDPTLEVGPGNLRVEARVPSSPDRVVLYYALSGDKVWNSPEVTWERVEMSFDPSRGAWVSPALPYPPDLDLAYAVVVEENLTLVNSTFAARFSTPLQLHEVLPPKTCAYDPACVPGRICVSDRSGYEPGDVLNVEFLGVEPPREGGEYEVAVLYVDYWSEAYGGVRIGAKLFWPIGEPPSDGWPVKIFSHGFGGPGSDYWHYPFVDEPNGGPRGTSWGVTYASHGFASLNPWQAGAGPSEPFMGYSPLSIWETKKVLFDGLKALEKLPDFMRNNETALSWLEGSGLDPSVLRLDQGRVVVSTNCISTPTLVALARELTLNRSRHPEAWGVRAFVADTFNPSVAYTCHCLTPILAENYTGRAALAHLNIWISVVWTLAEERGWDKDLFFTDELIKLYSAPRMTPAGVMPLVRSAQVEPPDESDLVAPMWSYLTERYGFDESTPGIEVARVLLTGPMLRLMTEGEEDVGAILGDPFYRAYFARTDPFFEENVEPFDPGVPLLVLMSGSDSEFYETVGTSSWHAECMAIPKVETLRSWGWDVEYLYARGKDFSSTEGEGLRWCLERLSEALYGGEAPRPPEQRAGWTEALLALALFAVASVLALTWLKTREGRSRSEPDSSSVAGG